MASRPNLADFNDYRQIIDAFYQYKHLLHTGFSWRRFAQLAGFKSPNYLQTIIDGKKNLTPDAAEQVARVLGFSQLEKTYFTALVRMETATTNERADVDAVRRASQRELGAATVSHAGFSILDDWYHIVVLELANLRDFDPSGKWIAAALNDAITPQQAEASLQLLLSLGFLHRTDVGKIVQSNTTVIVERKSNPRKQRCFHCKNLRAMATIAEFSAEEAEFNISNLSIPRSKIPELAQALEAAARNVVGTVVENNSPDAVVQLGFFMLPLTVSKT